MKIHTETIQVNTKASQSFEDIGPKIREALEKSGIKEGRVTLFVPHTTAAVTINENADPDVVTDMLLGLDKAFPDRREFKHMEGNSHAHLKSSAVGVDQTILVSNGSMLLGTWQGLFFCEFDGPRNRKLHIRITGE